MFLKQAYAGTLPLAATDLAVRWDHLYEFLIAISAFFFIAVMALMIFFAIRYRHRPGVKPKYLTGSHTLEAIFVFGPTFLLLLIFFWGYAVYHQMTQAPANAYEIHVIAKQWVWQFQYDNGRTTTAEVYVPLNRPVKMIMTSQDVIHSFFVPNFRIKQDVVPGMYSSVWFEARIPGKHQIFCAEYCGTSHSQMLAKVIVLTDDQWRAWNDGKKIENIPDARDVAANWDAQRRTAESDSIATGESASRFEPVLSLAQQGKALFQSKGCVSCHGSDGNNKLGPSLRGIYGHPVLLSDGSQVMRDENYLRESIEQPQAKVVRGYNPVMPTFQGLVNETEMNALIAYIKSLK